MESNKLGKKIRDWTINLGFRLPDGSAPPPDFFAFLTVTPHRRQLWETLMETIQPREKVEIMRKQILVAKLQERKKRLNKPQDSKQTADRIDLWFKQKALESEVNEKRKANIKMEGNILERASSLIFEIYKMGELENQIKELGEKAMVLKLISKRGNRIVEDLDRDVVKLKESRSTSGVEISEGAKNELFNTGKCECSKDGIHECELLNKINKICECGIREQQLWEEVVKRKKSLLSDFSDFLEELNSTGRNSLSEKRDKIETILNRAITELKQKVTEKSVQAMINSVEGKQLDLEMEKLEERLLEGMRSGEGGNESLNLISDKMNVSSEECELAWKNIKNYLNLMGLKCYQEFLTEKTKAEEETYTKERKENSNPSEILQRTLKDLEFIAFEIDVLQRVNKNVEEKIIGRQEEFESRLLSQKEEAEAKAKGRALESVLDKLKLSAEQQLELLLETPLAAFRTVKNSSGRLAFECESASDCSNSFCGELKHFFSTMLLPPSDSPQKILSEIERRKKISNDITAFASGRENLSAAQRRIRDQLASIRHDSQTCDRNHKDSDRILRGVTYKAEELLQESDFVERILKNWVEQPYRLMVRGTLEGRSLREHEEMCRKAMKF